MIQRNNITKTYTSHNETVTIFRDTTRHVQTWDFVIIKWPSGSGKSTALQLIAGLWMPDHGDIVINDIHISSLNETQRTLWRGQNLSMIFQDFKLLPLLTVQENLDLIFQITPQKPRTDHTKILDILGIHDKLNRFPHELSWWEQQRVAIARAFWSQTWLVLADEPTWNLDTKNAHKVMELFMELHHTYKTTVVMITHDESLLPYADHLFGIEHENLIAI